MSYNAKNYTEQGGDTTIIGGTLEFTSGGKVKNFPQATKSTVGGIKAVEDLEDCAASDVVGVNAFINSYLLPRLRESGVLK